MRRDDQTITSRQLGRALTGVGPTYHSVGTGNQTDRMNWQQFTRTKLSVQSYDIATTHWTFALRMTICDGQAAQPPQWIRALYTSNISTHAECRARKVHDLRALENSQRPELEQRQPMHRSLIYLDWYREISSNLPLPQPPIFWHYFYSIARLFDNNARNSELLSRVVIYHFVLHMLPGSGWKDDRPRMPVKIYYLPRLLKDPPWRFSFLHVFH